jgi:hypothetical protein
VTNNPSRINFSKNAEKARQQTVQEAKTRYGLSTAKEVAKALGISIYSVQRYARHEVFTPRMIVLQIKLFDLDLCRVQFQRQQKLVSETRAKNAVKNHLAHLKRMAEKAKDHPPKPPKPLKAIKPKPEPVPIKVIPTKTPVVSTPLPKPNVKKSPLRAPVQTELRDALADCWKLDSQYSRQNWTQIVQTYDRQGHKRQ